MLVVYSFIKYIIKEFYFLIKFIFNFFKKFSFMSWLLLYSFLTPSLSYNFFTCSYLRNEVFSNDEYTFLSLLIYFTYFIFKFFIKNLRLKLKNKKLKNKINLKKKFNNNLSNYLNIKLYKIESKNVSLLFILKFFIKRLFIKIRYLLGLINFFNIILIFIEKTFNNINTYWNPIFKASSIYAFYKSTRLKYIDIKNENFENLKY